MPFCRPKCCASLAPRAADRSTVRVAHKRHAQEHRVENWSYSAAPFRAAGADQAKMAWLAAGSQAFTVLLPLLGRLLLSCCVSCCAGPPQASGCCSSTNAPARPTGIISWRV